MGKGLELSDSNFINFPINGSSAWVDSPAPQVTPWVEANGHAFNSTWTMGARQLVVQEALDTTLWFALSYSVWFTPQTSQFWITQWHSRADGFQMSEHESPLQPYGHQTPSNSSMNSLSYKCSFPSGISSHVWWHQRLYPKQNPMIIPSLSH